MITQAKLEKYIGKLVLAFLELEETIDGVIAITINDRSDDIGLIITAEMPFQMKLNIWYKLTYQHIDLVHIEKSKLENFQNLERIFKGITNVQRSRNQILHAIKFTVRGKVYIKVPIRDMKKLNALKEIDEDGINGSFNSSFPKYKISEFQTNKDWDNLLKEIDKMTEEIYVFSEMIFES